MFLIWWWQITKLSSIYFGIAGVCCPTTTSKSRTIIYWGVRNSVSPFAWKRNVCVSMWLTVLGQGREQGCQRPTLSHPHMFLCYEDPSQFPNPSKYKYMQILILTQSEPNSNPNSWKSVDFKKKKKSPHNDSCPYIHSVNPETCPRQYSCTGTHTHTFHHHEKRCAF